MKVSRDSLILENAVRILRASYAALPTETEMTALIVDSQNAEGRGYYDPLEDERLRAAYARYLGIRAAIWEMIQTLKPHFKKYKSGAKPLSERDHQAFAIAFCGAEIIVRTGEYLIGLARERDIVWKKLDEAELRYGLGRKSFTRLYRQLTSAFRMHGFYQARDYFDANRTQIRDAVSGDDFKAVAYILENLNLPSASRGDHLRRYRRFVNFSLRRRSLSTGHKATFMLFEAAGSDIAELKIPLVKNIGSPKRVSTQVIEALKPQLRPGDVFITRHDDAMSNLFLPGFWPHGALYIGTAQERAAMGLGVVSDGIRSSDETVNILEAKKDGVLLREIEETLAVDAFTVLRPNLSDTDIKTALTKALSHAGKLYDFVFDFGTADRLVCTEVIYRAYHGVGVIKFELSTKAGRKCLSAEDFLNQGISKNWFDPVLIYGVGGDVFRHGEEARGGLAKSFEANF